MASRPQKVDLNPDQIKLTSVQADRLSRVSGVAAKDLAGQTVADIGGKLRFRIDPQLLLFRRVCGRVVKKDPATGKEYPVPFATVHVEDTDCSLLGYFPKGARWAWYYPYRCRREDIATVKTDECGNFCVWIPRWDIDWVLRFRRERFCFGTIFERPSLRDLLAEIPARIPIPRPGPDPDPGPLTLLDRSVVQQVESHLGADVTRNLGRLQSRMTFAASNVEHTAALDAPVLDLRIPPPVPAELRTDQVDKLRTSVAARVKIDAADLANLDPRVYIGPFKRCFDIFIPEWTPIIDVPDITFRVTQDTDGDGVEETIYSEGYFQVRWDAGDIPPVTIEARPNARAGLACGGDPVPCGDVPAIVLAGRMPVVDAAGIYDDANGYALRPNRPHPSGWANDPLPNPDAASPFEGTLTLFGCINTDPAATHYRVVYKYSANGGASFTDFAPFVNLTWPLFRLDGSGHLEWHYPAADANGWYPIALPPGPNPFLPQDIVLDWPTGSFANGRYVLKLELGTGGVASSSSAEVAFNVDNSTPRGPLTVEWRRVGGAFQPLDSVCPVIRRGSTPVDLEFQVTLEASASHLRYAFITAAGCGGGNFSFVSGNLPRDPALAGTTVFEHWHTATTDNAVTLQAVYRLPAGALQGTYSFSSQVSSRAFNPDGGDGGHLILPNPWEYDPAPLYNPQNVVFSVINTD